MSTKAMSGVPPGSLGPLGALGHISCFWCGGRLFRSGDCLVCPDDGAVFDAETYTTVSTTARA